MGWITREVQLLENFDDHITRVGLDKYLILYCCSDGTRKHCETTTPSDRLRLVAFITYQHTTPRGASGTVAIIYGLAHKVPPHFERYRYQRDANSNLVIEGKTARLGQGVVIVVVLLYLYSSLLQADEKDYWTGHSSVD